MNNVIVTDIFGRTPALETLARDIGSVAAIIDPYDKASMNFAAEPLAYEYFMTHVGIFAYKQLIAARLAESARIDLLIGFSVGAAAIWRISGSLSPGKIARAVCFYGSQIRHATDMAPESPRTISCPEKSRGSILTVWQKSCPAKKTFRFTKPLFCTGS